MNEFGFEETYVKWSTQEARGVASITIIPNIRPEEQAITNNHAHVFGDMSTPFNRFLYMCNFVRRILIQEGFPEFPVFRQNQN